MPTNRSFHTYILVALSWLVVVCIACAVFVNRSLDHAEVANERELYVYDPMFQVISFFIVYGVPALLILAAALLITNRVLGPQFDD